MAERSHDFRILPLAWVTWEGLPEIDHRLDEAVDALLSLRDSDVVERFVPNPGIPWWEREGVVFGLRLRMVGAEDSVGRWTSVWTVVHLRG